MIDLFSTTGSTLFGVALALLLAAWAAGRRRV